MFLYNIEIKFQFLTYKEISMSNLKTINQKKQDKSSSVTTDLFANSNGYVVQVKECKICLASQEDDLTSHFIQPCKCTGSLKYVHQQCLNIWLKSCYEDKKKKEEQKLAQQIGLQCELCKQRIMFDVKQFYGCGPIQEIREKIKEKKIIFWLYMFIFVAFPLSIGLFIRQLIENSSTTTKIKMDSFAIKLSIYGSIILFMLMLVSIIIFLIQFVIKKYVRIQSIRSTNSNEVIQASQAIQKVDYKEQQSVCQIKSS